MPPKQRFIPGLNSRPDDVEMPPRQPEKTDLDFLQEDFLKGKKNAAMCLHEYCQKLKLDLQFKEGPVVFKQGDPRTFGNYGCYAFVSGDQYPQGVGSNKKEAKIAASKHCLRALLGLDDFVPEKAEPVIDDNRYVEVRDLLDLCTAQLVYYEKRMTRDEKGVYTCAIHLSKHDPIKHSSADREVAVVEAHRKAIRVLRGNDAAEEHYTEEAVGAAEASSIVETPRVPDPFLAQQREQEAYDTLCRILETLPVNLKNQDHNIAAIFLSNQLIPDYQGIGQVVAFGTGNSSLGVEHLTEDGRCVIDSSATTTARRALKRYLGHEMLVCYSSGQESIFERSPNNPSYLRLKSGFEFHMFISHPPDGDYKESLSIPTTFTEEELLDISKGAHSPNFTDENSHGLNRCRNEHGMVEQANLTPPQTSIEQVRRSNEVWVMAPSDKLLRWNILGLQGAAYSHFLEQPLYLKSLSLGYHPQNDHGHLCRAVCCRVYQELEESFAQPTLYRINHPTLSLSPSLDVKDAAELGTMISPHSINWSKHDSRAELTDCATGRSNPASPFQVSQTPLSRQCKAGMHLKWFRDLSKYGNPALIGKSPLEVKIMAKGYQQIKEAFFQHCEANGIGNWIHMPNGQWSRIGK